MINEILSQVANLRTHTAWLRTQSPYFPEMFIDKRTVDRRGEETSYSTLVRIFRDEKWYTIHCVEKDYTNTPESIVKTLDRLYCMAYMNMFLYRLTGDPIHEVVDDLQIGEAERLAQTIPTQFPEKPKL